MFLNISASAPTSFPRSDCYYQFGICHVITFAVFIYTYICTPIWFFSHTNGISHYFLTCFLYLINNMSCECRSIVQNPEILNYAYFLQSTTLFCADRQTFILPSRGTTSMKPLSCETFIVFFLCCDYLFASAFLFNLKFCEEKEWFIHIYTPVSSMGPCL